MGRHGGAVRNGRDRPAGPGPVRRDPHRPRHAGGQRHRPAAGRQGDPPGRRGDPHDGVRHRGHRHRGDAQRRLPLHHEAAEDRGGGEPRREGVLPAAAATGEPVPEIGNPRRPPRPVDRRRQRGHPAADRHPPGDRGRGRPGAARRGTRHRARFLRPHRALPQPAVRGAVRPGLLRGRSGRDAHRGAVRGPMRHRRSDVRPPFGEDGAREPRHALPRRLRRGGTGGPRADGPVPCRQDDGAVRWNGTGPAGHPGHRLQRGPRGRTGAAGDRPADAAQGAGAGDRAHPRASGAPRGRAVAAAPFPPGGEPGAEETAPRDSPPRRSPLSKRTTGRGTSGSCGILSARSPERRSRERWSTPRTSRPRSCTGICAGIPRNNPFLSDKEAHHESRIFPRTRRAGPR